MRSILFICPQSLLSFMNPNRIIYIQFLKSRLLLLVGSLVSLSFFAAFLFSSDPDQLSFNLHVRPILNSKCVRCHGGVKKNGGLSLLTREAALQMGESGHPAIVPGDPGASELIFRINHSDPEIRMPLEGDPLTEEEIDILTRWVRDGADWETHWAYIPPQAVAVPEAPPTWGKHELDAFVYERMAAQGLQPNPPASAGALMRRLSLDLTGLPPDPELVQSLREESQPFDPDAYIDTLLQSPAFGEKWASMWLDLARYADSKGYERDPYRNIWQYRDWVIRALNEDMPFDEFTRLQLAGDLAAQPDAAAWIATAFHRNTMTNTEGGTDDEEFRVAAVLDRVNTTWLAWQGTTMECVQCHDHPYDPFVQKDYYQSFALFNNTQDNDLVAEFPVWESFEPEQETKIRGILSWLDQNDPQSRIDSAAHLNRQLQQAWFPEFIAGDCDDFQHVTIYGDRVVSNWTNNVNAGAGRTFLFKFSQVDLTGIEGITYTYASPGDDGAIDLRIDRADGPVWAFSRLPETGKIRGNEGGSNDSWNTFFQALEPQKGRHDLYFIIRNTTGEVPEGIITLQSFRFQLEDDRESPGVRARKDSLKELRKAAIRTPIFKDRTSGNQRTTRIFERGNWLIEGDTVLPAIPAVFASPDKKAEALDRKAFAEWLVSQQNPLTARVLVNRIWEQLFGRGLVLTSEDFGTQGEPPTHPELLDWLALRLMHTHRWRLKPLIREILSSATYQQSTLADPEKWEKDPDNLYLARASRLRLSAEQVRDQALSVSGLLNTEMYGPPVMPYQPEGVWQNVYSSNSWKTSEDGDQYRRAIYTYWRRTSPYPSMLTFDSPSREFCVSRRIRTNTPLQALVTLNDPVYAEAARALGQWMAGLTPEGPEAIRPAWLRALGQEPTEGKIRRLTQLYQESLAHYRQDAAALKALLPDTDAPSPHLAAYITVATAILNLDEFITRS